MYLRSQTESRFGSARAKSRSTRSGAEGRFGRGRSCAGHLACRQRRAETELAHQPGDTLAGTVLHSSETGNCAASSATNRNLLTVDRSP